METRSYTLYIVGPVRLFILPIRNGNEVKVKVEGLDEVTFYPTYKEWKLST